MSTLKELLAQRAALDAKIAEQQSADRARVISEIKALMADYGLTAMDLAGTPRARAEPRQPVAAKYRDQSTGETWSGRGLQPKWLKAKIAAGAKLEDFKV
jgi:DNA-binding protein H-NS